MSMIQRRKRAVERTWMLYYVITHVHMQEGDSMPAFVWETLPIMLLATVVSLLTGRVWDTAIKWAIQI